MYQDYSKGWAKVSLAREMLEKAQRASPLAAIQMFARERLFTGMYISERT